MERGGCAGAGEEAGGGRGGEAGDSLSGEEEKAGGDWAEEQRVEDRELCVGEAVYILGREEQGQGLEVGAKGVPVVLIS